ncbi:MAG: aldehyde ferredoxin oxidoreductase family protein [Deltaproteobacteria bacterium]|nr:aldehyde ferredoxin oxidoreductase family protein [Deltaproteobacteria bacterium]MBW2340396.1 aldehyde ferredoxin oxidoreductase family protein [Deltaproteobacteria bacterium]
MSGGYTGRMGFVDLSRGEVREEQLDENLARDFIGGYGLGVRILYERQKGGVNPLGPENILGFTTGPLTGTQTPTGGRYMAVCKSPLTGGWGDANSGGYFGSELKSAGWDAIFVSGIAASPRYLVVTEEGLELKDASHVWGRDTVDTEDALRKDLGISKLRVACIGPASERLSLISGIVNDKGRIAARSGLGAVMGSKRLKAVAVHGKGKVAVANKERLSQLRKAFLKELRESGGFPKLLRDYGTCGLTGGLVTSGATPIKNWLLAGDQAFPTVDKIADGDTVIQYQVKRYGCANCPIACGGIFSVKEGRYPVKEVHKPEYETIGAFGAMCMNDDLLSIIKMNDMCNRSGLDTISAGSVLAFAMECFEKGIITASDTEGIEITWGNAKAMIVMLDKIIRREGFGDILADGVKVAAQKLGKGAEAYAMHVGGQEPGLHNALFLPSRGTGFVCDPTPGRHTAAPMARIDASSARVAPYPELQFKGFETYEYMNKGPASATTSCYWQVGACAGVCLFPTIFFGNYPLLDFLNAVTGWDMDISEALETGARIQTLRQAFNIREGLSPREIKLPTRMAGIPPKGEGPLAGITIDIDSLRSEYYKAMGWDPGTGYPSGTTLDRLGIKELTETN